ncbi:MAG: hypothetical protein AUG44_16640 [Actinobacteria bacterium 13_1_20CM_3_71_11]|nr:MAG: hypothetical protein AUG44_16640 [Actinobacteria bacterium 13_1_20CM_3_71_11]
MTGFLDANRPPGFLPPDYAPRHQLFEAPRSNPLGWARRRRMDREARRDEAARDRAVTRLAKLGAGWKVLDVAELGLAAKNTFLAIGPGGVFLVTVKPQGRSRVRLAGDVVQVDGRRLGYVAEARKLAEQASKAMSRTARSTIPVTPVIALAGNGMIDVHGLPKGCVVTSHRELDYILGAYGERIAPGTVSKLYSIARHPVTWAGQKSDQQVEEYTWYPTGAATDKRPDRR